MSNLKIIKIIDENQVIINQGFANGISDGDIFEIFLPGVEVVDEEDGRSYGTLDYVKAKIEATQVFAKMTICKNYATKTTTLLERISVLDQEFASRLPLNINPLDMTGGFENISKVDKQIKVGDLVRKANSSPNQQSC